MALFLDVGAVFNRDFPGNRGRPATSSTESRPLPLTIYFYLNDFEFFEVSYKRSVDGGQKAENRVQNIEGDETPLLNSVVCHLISVI